MAAPFLRDDAGLERLARSRLGLRRLEVRRSRRAMNDEDRVRQDVGEQRAILKYGAMPMAGLFVLMGVVTIVRSLGS